MDAAAVAGTVIVGDDGNNADAVVLNASRI